MTGPLDARRLRFRRIATMHYEVKDNDGQVLGWVWRTRHGWTVQRPDGSLAIEDSAVSRATAAGLLRKR